MGITMVCSLLTSEEERELELTGEAEEVKARKIRFVSMPIADRQVPKSEAEVVETLKKIDAELVSGGNVLVHCRQGIGRTGLIASSLLVMKGWTAEDAVKMLTGIRGVRIPETEEQRVWIDRFAASVTASDSTLHKQPSLNVHP
jgi:protein-tyrosine phosphatase